MADRDAASERSRAKVFQGLLIACAVLVASAQIANAFTDSTALGLKAIWSSCTALLTLLAVIFGWRKSRAEDRARTKTEALVKAEKERSSILLGHNLREVFDAVESLTRQEPRRRQLEIAGVRQSAAVQTKDGVGALEVRAAYYRVDDILSARRKMTPDKVASSPDRTDTFTAVFDESSGRHPNVWSVLDGHESTYFVEDVRTHVDPRWDFSYMTRFSTFITARVSAGGVNFGVLTVNAVNAGSLVKEDIFLVEAVARILGIAELMCMSTQAYRNALTAQSMRDGTSVAPHTFSIEGGNA